MRGGGRRPHLQWMRVPSNRSMGWFIHPPIHQQQGNLNIQNAWLKMLVLVLVLVMMRVPLNRQGNLNHSNCKDEGVVCPCDIDYVSCIIYAHL